MDNETEAPGCSQASLKDLSSGGAGVEPDCVAERSLAIVMCIVFTLSFSPLRPFCCGHRGVKSRPNPLFSQMEQPSRLGAC